MPGSWYRRGLRFHCQRCGRCCTGRSGYVWVTEEEIARIAACRGETPEAFARADVRRVDGKLSLLERPDGACELYDRDAGCTAYADRPCQCRTWPFWPVNLATPEAWKQTATTCPGVGAGDRVPADAIDRSAASSM